MTREEMLDKAKQMVTGQREQDYGSPENNFGRIGQLWTDYLGHLVTAEDVANMMILFKVARNKTGTGTEDTWVDIAGYAACGCEIATEDLDATKPTDEEKEKLSNAIFGEDYGCEVVEGWINDTEDVCCSLFRDGGMEVEYLGPISEPDIIPYVDAGCPTGCYLELQKRIGEAESAQEKLVYRAMKRGLTDWMAKENRKKKEDDIENH